jgi:hypothetical protein
MLKNLKNPTQTLTEYTLFVENLNLAVAQAGPMAEKMTKLVHMRDLLKRKFSDQNSRFLR